MIAALAPATPYSSRSRSLAVRRSALARRSPTFFPPAPPLCGPAAAGPAPAAASARRCPRLLTFDPSDRGRKIHNEQPHAVLSFVQTFTMPSTGNVAKTDTGIEAINAILERDVQVTQPRRLLHIPLHLEIT